jgi:hypothetical protein
MNRLPSKAESRRHRLGAILCNIAILAVKMHRLEAYVTVAYHHFRAKGLQELDT